MDAILRTAVAKDFWWFVSKAFSHLEGTKLKDQHYLKYICSMLEQLERGKIRRVIVNAPPRHLKTLICSVCFVAWSLGRNPALRVLLISYNEDFADDIVSTIRKLMRADWYRKAFPKFRVDKWSRSEMKTTKGGSLRPASRSGTVTGHGADLIVIDDPHKIGDERRPNGLVEDVDHFIAAVLSRVNNPQAARYLVVAQRIHADDLSGRLLADGGWSHVCLPLVAEKETILEVAGRRRWKRRVGAVLRPDAWPIEEVERMRRQLGPNFAAMYQQSPAKLVAIEAADFPLFENRPYTPHGVVLSVDTAHSDKPGASFTVVQAWQPCRDHHLLLDQHRERVQPGRLERILEKCVRLYAPGQILIEYTGAGIGLATIAEKRYPGIVSRIVPYRSKIERFDQILVLVKSNRVKLPQNAPWLSDFLDEVTCFPEADTDDQCDAMSAYLNWAADHGPVEPGQAQGIGLLAMVSPGRRLEFPRFRGRLQTYRL